MVQVKVTIRSSNCFLMVSHKFNTLEEARRYTTTLRASVAKEDEIKSTIYLNSRYDKN